MSSSARWQGNQRRIGLTGGIATGKSSVGRYLAALGIPVLDADRYAHDALAPGSDAATAVLQRYGARVLETSDRADPERHRSINRKALGSIVFNEPKERLWLERLVHPFVRTRFADALQQHSTASTVVLMVPLLFEAGLNDLCSEVWVVHCSATQQLKRLQIRDGLDEKEAKARIAAQWSVETKQQWADQCIDNSTDPEHWKEQIQRLL